MNRISAFRQSVFDIFRATYPYKLLYIRNRSELPIILNKRGLTGIGVEVGVWKAEFSEFLLDKWKGKLLYSVDPWKNFSTEEYIDDMNINQTAFDTIHANVKQLLSKYGDRSAIIRDVSVTASKYFEDNTLDFAYLDGRHDYSGVKEDIESWYPKVKDGGIICGHDYLNGIINKTEFGVKKAVDEFASGNNFKILVTDKDDYPSWFIIKS
jgi:Methyltransferase domain